LQASGTVTNPWFTLPLRIISSIQPSDNPWDITERCRIDLDEHGLQLFFQKDEITFVFLGNTDLPRYFVAPIEYLLCYRTFINYNVIWPALRVDPGNFPRVETVDFKNVESTISISKTAITDYLRTLNDTLYYAL